MMMIDDAKFIDDKAQEDVQVAREDVIIIESEHGFAPLGEPNEQLRHALMTDRDIADQHPIGAITGLQNELDKINALKTVCSNKRHQADYYLWEDENPLQEVREGLFVSICEDTNRIKICSNKDEIYGVVVGNAAFVGAQAADYQRDYRYALVVYIGAVAVQCELDVDKGDFVTSNPYGIAKKSETGYGARVVAKANIEGVPHAFVALGLLTTQVEEIAQAVDDLEARMDLAEINIISAINTANEAYKLISSLGDIGKLNVDTVQKADEALDKANTALSTADKLDEQIAKALKISTQARSIADSAVASAEAIRAEAVATANQALSEITGAIKEIEELSYELNVDFNKTQKELEVKKEAMQREIDEIRAEYEGLDGALADFKQEVADTYATNLAFAAFSTKTSDTIAATKQEAEKTYAKITDVVSFQNETTEAIAGVRQEASETYATIDSLTSLDTKTSKSVANLKQEVKENYATVESVASVETAASEAMSTFKQEVTDTYATKSSVQMFTDSLGQSITQVEEKAKDNEASINALATLQREDRTSIANVKIIAEDNKSEIQNLTAFKTNTQTAMASIQQTADANGASIRHLVAEIDKHSVGEYSQAYGLTLAEAQSILEVGFIYVPTNAHSETYSGGGSSTFTKGYYYTWNGTNWVDSGSPLVAFSTATPASSGAIKYWYVDGTPTDEQYESETLYKWQNDQWIAVATLKGNISSRAVSQIRQTANSIALEVTNIEGALAGMQTILDADSAKINSIAAWPSDIGDGKYNMALLKQHSDGDSSHLALVAIRNVSEDINNPDYKLEELGGARIVLADDSELGSYIQMDADQINFGENVFISNTTNDVMNVAGNFVVDRSGNLRLNGNITWGTHSSPTQVVYCAYNITKPANGTAWANFPATSTTSWHTKWSDDTDCYGSYTYDGGNTWGEPIRLKGKDGTGVAIKGAAYTTTNSSSFTTSTVLLLYSNESCTNQITSVAAGDTYLVSGYLFVYSGTGYYFRCMGKFQGEQGPQGNSSYLHIRYSVNANGYPMTTTPSTYIGMYVDYIATDSDNYWDYTWSRFMGEQGPQGAPGVGIQGPKGDSIVYLYYKHNNASPPSTPIYNGGALPSGWSLTPYEVSASYPYVFVSQCIVASGVYGTWSVPTCWAKWGADGSATVNDINVFNALTSNGTMYGCFGQENNKLYINANYIKSGQIDSALVLAGQVTANNLTATGGTIGGFTIGTNSIYNTKTAYNNSTAGVYIGTDGIGLGANTFSVSSAGELTATSGTIGGFTLNQYGIYDNSDRTVGMISDGRSVYRANSTTAAGYIRFFAGCNKNYGVAASTSTSAEVNNIGNFIVTSTGYLYAKDADIAGKITSTSGDIGGFTIGTNSLSTGVRSYFYTADPSYMSGVYLTPDLSKDASSSIFTPSNSGGISFGSYNSSSGLYSQQCIYAGRHVIRGKIASAGWAGTTQTANGFYFMYNTSGDISPIYETSYCVGKIVCLDSKVTLDGAWYGTSSVAITSARSLKSDIDSLSDEHTVLFDNLIPRRFKYNDGTSNRIHYGLIVDELKDAMDTAGLTPDECAAYCLTDPDNPDGDGGIRYSELIALCIKEIQTLKAKVASLEGKQ